MTSFPPFSRRNTCFKRPSFAVSAACLTLLSAALPPLGSVQLHAQAPTPPPGDSWKKPTGGASWTINFRYQYAYKGAEAESVPVAVNVTVVGSDVLKTIQYPNKTSEVWQIGDQTFVSEAGSDVAVPYVDPNSQAALATPAADGGASSAATVNPTIAATSTPEEQDWASLQEFAWIKPDLYKGTIELAGERVLIYALMPPEPKFAGKAPPATKYPAGPLGGLPLQPGIKVAAILENTRLPKYLQIDADLRQYTFRPVDRPKLEVPPKIAQYLVKDEPTKPGAAPVSLIP